VSVQTAGVFCFGLFVGFITYRTLIRATTTAVSDLAAVIAAVGGGAVAAIAKPGTDMFGWYAIALLVGFIGVEELIREALSIQEESLAADDAMLVTARLELGKLLAEDEGDEEASELLASAVEHTEGAQLGRALTSLGLIAQRCGEFGRAEQHFRRALELADGPVNRLIGRRNLVMLLIDERRLAEADELAQETVERATEWFGTSDPRIGEALLTYIKAIREQGRFGECEQLARTALGLLENAYPGDHRDVVDAANELGLALSGQGKMAEAEQWFQRVAVSVRGDPRREAPALMSQAAAYKGLGDFGRAASLVTKAAGLLETSSGRQSPQYGKALARRGELERIQGQMTAVTTLTTAYRIIEGAQGEHPSLVEPLSELAMLYLDIGARDTATAFAERALTIARAAYGAGNPALARTLPCWPGARPTPVSRTRPKACTRRRSRAIPRRQRHGAPSPISRRPAETGKPRSACSASLCSERTRYSASWRPRPRRSIGGVRSLPGSGPPWTPT
jgi:tetratricopeptide (TPR) repeat protein